MRKFILLFTCFTISISTYSQGGKGYIVTKDKSQVACESLEISANEGSVKCKNGEVKTKYKMKDLDGFVIDNTYYLVDNKGSYIGHSVMENEKYLMICLMTQDNMVYWFYDRDHVRLDYLPKGKGAGAQLLKYFGDCPEAKKILEQYQKESQKIKFDYPKFHQMIADYNASPCRKH